MNWKKELENKGYSVKIITRRHLRGDKNLYSMSAIREFKFGPFVSPKGGEVEARITNKDGIVARGISICHLSDNFKRKDGVKIAVERALGILEIIPYIQ